MPCGGSTAPALALLQPNSRPGVLRTMPSQLDCLSAHQARDECAEEAVTALIAPPLAIERLFRPPTALNTAAPDRASAPTGPCSCRRDRRPRPPRSSRS